MELEAHREKRVRGVELRRETRMNRRREWDVRRCVSHFFFFFFKFYFSLNRQFLLIRTNMARVGANWPDSVRIGPSLHWVGLSRETEKRKGKKKKKRTRHWRTGSGVARASPRLAGSVAGAAAILSRSCIPALQYKMLGYKEATYLLNDWNWNENIKMDKWKIGFEMRKST